jgi:hypothetical protein
MGCKQFLVGLLICEFTARLQGKQRLGSPPVYSQRSGSAMDCVVWDDSEVGWQQRVEDRAGPAFRLVRSSNARFPKREFEFPGRF